MIPLVNHDSRFPSQGSVVIIYLDPSIRSSQMLHGAGIFTNISPKNHQVLLVNIPAPWFAYGINNMNIMTISRLIVVINVLSNFSRWRPGNRIGFWGKWRANLEITSDNIYIYMYILLLYYYIIIIILLLL